MRALTFAMAAMVLVAATALAESATPAVGTRYVVGVSGMH